MNNLFSENKKVGGTLLINAYTTECSCGYGRGGWASSPALKDPPQPVLTPDTRGECPGCGEEFKESFNLYTLERVKL